MGETDSQRLVPHLRLLGLASRFRYELGTALLTSVSTCLVMLVLLRFPHPPGGDGGQWLGVSNAVLGQGISRIGTLSYPPLYFLLLAGCIVAAGGPIPGLYASIGIILFLLPFSAFASYSLVTKDKRGALLFAFVVAFAQPLLDMLGWGGYPNLLSFVFLMPAFAFLVRSSLPGAVRMEFLLLGLFAALTFLTHPLSSFFFAIGAALYFILLQWYQRDRVWLKRLVLFALPVFALLYLPYYLLRLGPTSQAVPNYLIEQPVYSLDMALFTVLPAEFRKVFPFTTTFTILLASVVTILAAHPLPAALHRKSLPATVRWLVRPLGKRLGVRSYLLFLVTLTPPLAVPVLFWSARVYTDYGRLLYYVTFPAAALWATLLSRFLAPDSIKAAWAAARSALPGRDQARVAGVGARPEDPSRRTLRRRIVTDAPAVAIVLVSLAVLGNSGMAYVNGASVYYSSFDTQEDSALAAWIRGNTPVDSTLLLSPHWENQRTFKWIEGLTGRVTMGYSQPRYLFYEREIEVNHDVQLMSDTRWSVRGGSFELSTDGTREHSRQQLRVSVINRGAAYPVFDIRDDSSELYFTGGGGLFFTEFVDRMISKPDSGSPGIKETAVKDSPILRTEREAVLTGQAAEIKLRSDSPHVGIAGYSFRLHPAQSYCNILHAPGTVTWQVPNDRGGCFTIKITGSPSLRTEWTGWDMIVNLGADSQGSSTLRVEALNSESGLPLGTFFSDAIDLYEKYSVDYVVLISTELERVGFLEGEYGFQRVFENAKYVLLRAVRTPDRLDSELVDWLLPRTAGGEAIVFGPLSERFDALRIMRDEFNRFVIHESNSRGRAMSGEMVDPTGFRMMRYKLAVSNNLLTAGVYGPVLPPGSGFRFSFTGSHGVFAGLDVPEDRFHVALANGTGLFVGEMVEGNRALDAGPAVLNVVRKDVPEISLFRKLMISGSSAELAINISSSQWKPAAYAFAMLPRAPICSVSQGPSAIDLGIWDGGRCILVTLTGGAGFQGQWSEDVAIISLKPDQNGAASLLVRVDSTGSAGNSQGIVADSLYAESGVRFVVLVYESSGETDKLITELGFGKVFQNERYVILDVAG